MFLLYPYIWSSSSFTITFVSKSASVVLFRDIFKSKLADKKTSCIPGIEQGSKVFINLILLPHITTPALYGKSHVKISLSLIVSARPCLFMLSFSFDFANSK